MEDKKQDLNSLEELVKTADSYRAFFANLADELSKVLADIQVSKKEEDTWEMKNPYKNGDYHWVVYEDGSICKEKWLDFPEDDSRFLQGNIFPNQQAAELEAKRRNLLTRFRAFRDECNGDWKMYWSNYLEKKYYIAAESEGIGVCSTDLIKVFPIFGYFKTREDAERAIELFGDEIKELFVEAE